MKEKTTIPKRVKGTVLFTVVAVMMVLIVFMTATLALAASANRRAYAQFQKHQTEATARTVLDAAMQAINDDIGDSGGLKDQISKTSTSMTMNVSASDGLNEIVTVTNTGKTKSVFDADQGTWVEGAVYELRTTVVNEATGSATDYCAYIVEGYTESTSVNNTHNSDAFVAGGASPGASTGGFVMGGSSIGIALTPKPASLGMINDSSYMAPMYINTENYQAAANVTVYFNKVASKSYFAMTGDFTPANNFRLETAGDIAWPAGDVKYTDIPCMYIEGVFHRNSSDLDLRLKDSSGDAVIPLNLYCGSIASDRAGEDIPNRFEVMGNIYCFDENANSNLTCQNPGTKLYKWTSAQITGQDGSTYNEVFGSVYSKGSLQLGNIDVEGEARAEKDIEIRKNLNVGTGMVVGGTLTINSGCNLTVGGEVRAVKIVNNGNLNVPAGTNIYCYEYSGPALPNVVMLDATGLPIKDTVSVWYTDDTGAGVMVEKNPWWDGYKAKYQLTKHTRSASTGTEATGPIAKATGEEWSPNEANYRASNPNYLALQTEYNNFMAHNSEATAEVENIYDYNICPGEDIYPADYEKANLKSNVVATPVMSDYEYPTTLAELDDGSISISTTPYALGTVGTATNPITTSGRLEGYYDGNRGDIYIKADSPIVVDVSNFTFDGRNSRKIIVEENAAVYFFVENKFEIINGGQLITKDYDELLNHQNGDFEIEAVQSNENSPYFPNIYIYGAEGSEMKSNNNSFITANIRAQKMRFGSATGWSGWGGGRNDRQMTYVQYVPQDSNGDGVIDASDTSLRTTFPLKRNAGKKASLGLIGQLICDNTDISNEWTLVYVTVSNGGAPGPISAGDSSIPDHYTNLYYNYY